MEEIKIGPMLTDGELYDALDTEKYPEYKACKEAFAKGNIKEARKIFADNARNIFYPEKYYSLYRKELKPKLTDSLKATAERALKHNMNSCGTPMQFGDKVDWFANPTYNQYKEWTWQLSRHDELVALADAYRACGDERYAYGCAELLDSWIKQAIRPDIGVSSYDTLCWRTIECGIRMGLMWPNIIHTFAKTEAFTDDLIVDYFKSVYEHSVRMLNAFTRGNWLMHELNGLGQSGIFYPIFSDSDKWYNIAMTKIEEELRLNQIYADGFQFETSTGYHGVVIIHVTEVIEIAVKYGKEVPKSMYDVVENMLMLYVKLVQANGGMPHPNDGGGANCVNMIKRYARFFPENEIFKWFLSGKTEGKAPDFNSVLLENCGHIALRRSFNDGISAYFDAGAFGAGHQHEDKLNITISNKVHPVLCEAQTYAYDTSDMRKYCLSSRAHNVILVNGMEQNRRKSYKFDRACLTEKEKNVSLTVTPNIDIACGVYDDGYGSEQEKAAVHARKVIMLKNPKLGLPLFVVVDTMTSEKENEYQAIWHYDSTEASVDANRFTCAEMTQFVLGDVGELKIVCGQKEPVLQGWFFRTGQQKCEEPIPTLVHTYKGSDTKTVNVFAMHENGVCAVADAVIENGALIITYTDGSADRVEI